MLAFSIAQPLVLGISNGGAIGLVAIGLVLIYKSSRVFNFVAGEVATLAAAGVGLAWFFGRTDLGLAVLATSQEPTASRLVGIRLNRITLLTWGLAGLLGAVAGVLLAPVTSQFQAGYGTTTVLIAAFTAAVVGGMTSVPGAVVGGLLVGLVQAFAQINISSKTLPGANSVATLVMLLAVLLARPTGLLGKDA